jgi:hypothetical protein
MGNLKKKIPATQSVRDLSGEWNHFNTASLFHATSSYPMALHSLKHLGHLTYPLPFSSLYVRICNKKLFMGWSC